MQALLYVSQATVRPRPETVDAIVATAQRVNPTLGLTGVLLWSDVHFAQLLEGPADALDLMYARLAQDPRHRDLALLGRWAIAERLFSDWSMRSRPLAPRSHWPLLERAVERPGADALGWVLHLMADLRRPSRRGRGIPA